MDHPNPVSTVHIPAGSQLCDMDLEEAVEFLSDEFDIERSEYVQEVGRSVSELRD